MPILSTPETLPKTDFSKLLRYALDHGGPNPYRQVWQMFVERFGPRKITAQEYFLYALYRPGLTAVERRSYLSDSICDPFNESFSPRVSREMCEIIDTKLETEQLLRSQGIPAAETRAAWRVDRLPDHVTALTTPEAIRAFLSDPANFPLFGKPNKSAASNGVVWLDAKGDVEGTLRLGDGRIVATDDLIQDITSRWQTGFLFQKLQRNHSDLRPILGRATSTLRVCTLWEENGPEILYAVHKLPVPDAIHDHIAAGIRGHLGIDLATGRAVTARVSGRPMDPPRDHWADPNVPLLGLQLPHFHEAMELCRRAHRLFDGIGLIGWDVYLTDDGPVLNEANRNPSVNPYQLAFRKGLKSPENNERFRRARQAFLAHLNSRPRGA